MKLVVISWRDIPSQIAIRKGRSTTKRPLSARFQEAIDRAAMRAGKGGSQAYIEEWTRPSKTIQDDRDPEVIADEMAAEIEARYDDALLEAMVRNKGVGERGPLD